ncbi:hypothetical protein G6L89_007460 [Agrobacterium fabrum]|uniref:hypothetical protein n=1 Tax=Agrobacterium fabrum TaxID=1176649 RepID=UPI0015748A79|nr:hypothetical protein [Agrobacterium fabrum]NTB07662.1 hypothetical protein [Agrobacterium fabrum]
MFLLYVPLAVVILVAIIIIFAFNQPNWGARTEITKPPSIEMKVREPVMDPITFLSVLSSLITITGAIRDAGIPLTMRTVRGRYDEKANTPGTIEAKVNADDETIDRAASTVIAISHTDRLFLDRIQERCLKSFNEAIQDHALSDARVSQAYDQARICVCSNIKTVQKMHGGRVPDEFQELFERYRCDMI